MSRDGVHNTAPELKALLRRKLVDGLGGGSASRVLELYSGPGEMRRLAYYDAASWLGVDKDEKSPDAVHVDNCLFLRAVDLRAFNLFDADAFGSPWEPLWLVSRRRGVLPGELIALAITTGQQGVAAARTPNLRKAGWSEQMRDAVGVDINTANGWFCTAKGADIVSRKLVAKWFRHCSIERWIAARAKSGTVSYFGCLLRGN